MADWNQEEINTMLENRVMEILTMMAEQIEPQIEQNARKLDQIQNWMNDIQLVIAMREKQRKA